MTEFIVCAVEHHMGRTMQESSLLSAASRAPFESDIIPLLTDRSAIFVEGWSGACAQGVKGYRERLDALSPAFASAGVTPFCVGADPRIRKSNDKIRKMLKHMETAYAAVGRLRFDRVPKTLAQTIAATVEPPGFRVVQPLSMLQRQSIRNVQIVSARFDAAYVAAMRKREDRHDRIVLIVGCAHALRIHQQTGWRIEWLTRESPDFCWALFSSYFADYLWSV